MLHVSTRITNQKRKNKIEKWNSASLQKNENGYFFYYTTNKICLQASLFQLFTLLKKSPFSTKKDGILPSLIVEKVQLWTHTTLFAKITS